jgi:acyl-CoA reductase-like NAD-dependent aldehyde dehydrogenase
LLRTSRWSSVNEQAQFPVFDPATDRCIAIVQGGDDAQVAAALRAARAAFDRNWRWRPVSERSRMLNEAARVIRQHSDELAQLVAVQTGMLLSDARNVDVEECIQAFRYFGSAAITLPSALVDGGNYQDRIHAEPYGVVAVLTPTCWPLQYVGAKLAPALLAGNTVVLKPSCGSALAVIRLVELIAPIFPSDVLQLLLGRGEAVGQALVRHPLVSKVSVTGTTEVGQAVLQAAVDKVMPTILQLSSCNAIIVFDDADLNLALRATLEGAFSNHGEARSATPRILVQRRIHDRFLQQLARTVPRLKAGDGADPTTHTGPMSSRERQQQALRSIEAACEQGACIVAQAAMPNAASLSNGYFVPPTLLAKVQPHMMIVREPVNAPVACVMAFNTTDDAIAMTNDSRFGLLAAVFTQNAAVATDVSRRLDVGAVYVNNFQRLGSSAMPATGVKATGFGHEERCMATLAEFTRQHVVRVITQPTSTHYWAAVDELLGG